MLEWSKGVNQVSCEVCKVNCEVSDVNYEVSEANCEVMACFTPPARKQD